MSDQRQYASKQPTTARTAPKRGKVTQSTTQPESITLRPLVPGEMVGPYLVLPGGLLSRGRPCTADGCDAILYPATTQTYTGRDGTERSFATSELIVRGLQEFMRVYCRRHYVIALREKDAARLAADHA